MEEPLIFPALGPNQGPNNNNPVLSKNNKDNKTSSKKPKRPGWLSKDKFKFVTNNVLKAVKSDVAIDVVEFAKALYLSKYKTDLNEDSVNRIINFVQKSSGSKTETIEVKTNLGIVGDKTSTTTKTPMVEDVPERRSGRFGFGLGDKGKKGDGKGADDEDAPS
jgi:hypothetical protein